MAEPIEVGEEITFPKYTSFNYFEIWQPRWRDKVVLLAARKVGNLNKIKFTKAKSMGDRYYFVSGATIKKCKKETNGTIPCYAVPLGKLRPLEIEEKSHHDY